MDQTAVSLVNNLTIAAAAVIACIALWRAYNKSRDEHIADLREMNRENLADLRARMMVIEDALNIPRSDRVKYLPTMQMPHKGEMKDLD